MTSHPSETEKERTYIAIDLKSFYASAECVSRGLDPLQTYLVVADASRTEKTICLAVSPALKALGIPGRARLFEVIRQVREINAMRLLRAPGGCFSGASCDARALAADPGLKLQFLAAPPQMAKYMDISAEIYRIYLRYVAPEDIHVYSIDEVFIDATDYLSLYHLTPRELTVHMITAVLQATGITAAAGIGTNLYLAKVAMDIEAKRMPPDKNGVRIARLDEDSYRRRLWEHRPLQDFWKIGRGYARRLASVGLYTMGDIAACSLGKPGDFYCEELLFRLFGVNAELLMDHAWGYEPCRISHIRSYVPENRSISSGQVLQHPYTKEQAALIVREMADLLSMDLADKKLLTDRIVLSVGYDTENLRHPQLQKRYIHKTVTDAFNRKIPEHAHGSSDLGRFTASSRQITRAFVSLFEEIAQPDLLVRRITLATDRVTPEAELPEAARTEQLSLFDQGEGHFCEALEADSPEKEKAVQRTILQIRRKMGNNAILRGMNLKEYATARARNRQIGGHRA